jgi:hypothetical protein
LKLSAARLEKGLQVIDQDSIEEMMLWLSSLVGTGRAVKVGRHDADAGQQHAFHPKLSLTAGMLRPPMRWPEATLRNVFNGRQIQSL